MPLIDQIGVSSTTPIRLCTRDAHDPPPRLGDFGQVVTDVKSGFWLLQTQNALIQTNSLAYHGVALETLCRVAACGAPIDRWVVRAQPASHGPHAQRS